MKHSISKLIAPIIATAIVSLLGALDVAKPLGAHPFWSVNVAFYGLIPGLAFWWLFRRLGRRSVYVAFLALIVAIAAAYFGKQAFAASYAENTVAGKFWFYGWIATYAAVLWAIAAAFDRRNH